MIKKLKFILFTLTILFLTSSVTFAADTYTFPNVTNGNGGTALATYNSQTQTLTLESNWEIDGSLLLQSGSGTGDLPTAKSATDTNNNYSITNWVENGKITTLDLHGYTISGKGVNFGTNPNYDLIYVGCSKYDGTVNPNAESAIIKSTGSKGNLNVTIYNPSDSSGCLYVGKSPTFTLNNVNLNATYSSSVKGGGAVGIMLSKNASAQTKASIDNCVFNINNGNTGDAIGVFCNGPAGADQTVSLTNTEINILENNVEISPGLEAGAYGIYVKGDTAADSVGININSNVTINTPGVAIYQASSKTNTVISGNNVNIVGGTGVCVRGGSFKINKNLTNVNITANSPSYFNPNTISNNLSAAANNGSAIVIIPSGSSTTSNGYGNVSLDIQGNETCPKITSENGYAIEESPLKGGTSAALSNSQNPPMQVNGGVYTSGDCGGSNPDKEPFSSSAAEDSSNEDGTKFNAQNVITSGPVAPEYLDQDTEAGFIGVDSLGNPVYGYYDSQEQAQTAANIVNPGNPPTTIPIDPTSETQVPSYPSSSKIVTLQSGNSLMNYYNTGTLQNQETGIEIISSGGNIGANALNWNVVSLNGSNSTPSFSEEWTTGPFNGKPALLLTSEDGGWQIAQTYSSNAQNGYSFGPIYLVYTGALNTSSQFYQPGVYRLTATPNDTAGNTVLNNNLSANITYVINPVEVQNVRITYNGSAANSPLQLDLSQSRSYSFGYTATDESGRPVTGNIVSWSLTNSDNTGNPSYATVNKDTGLVTFTSNPPENSALVLRVTVDGVVSNPVLIMPTGKLSFDDVTGIKPVYETVNWATSNNYLNLNNNIVTTPVEMPITEGTLTFTSSDPNFIIYPTGGTETTPAQNILIPANSRGGSTTITATWKNGDESYETTFDVNYVTTAVPATGVTAESSLSFSLSNPTVQNVNASLTPENNTTQAGSLNSGNNGFTYGTSNSNVAVVDIYGNVTPVAAGTCTITTTFNGQLTAPTGQTTANNKATTTVTVIETPSDVQAEGITYSPEGPIYLAPSTVANAKSSETITASVEPENSTDELSVTIAPQTVATVTDNGDGTWTVNAVANGRATVTLQAGSITETIPVIVSSDPVVASAVTASGTTPDEFTVTVSNVQANPAISGSTASVNHVSIFTWTGPDQVDRQCVAVPNNVNGTYTYSPFEVNGNRPNTWYFDADNIYVQVYANVGGQEVYLGAATPNYSWVDCTGAQGKNVAYISYQENIGFVEPTVFDGNQSGLTGRHLQLEGLRVSSCIDGVDVITEVHAQNIGWMEAVDDGVYAGTQHENRQIEAIRLRLTGTNASNYEIYYQVHAENLGWTGPVSSNQIAGTVGQNRQIESVQIQIVPKGTQPTGWATN